MSFLTTLSQILPQIAFGQSWLRLRLALASIAEAFPRERLRFSFNRPHLSATRLSVDRDHDALPPSSRACGPVGHCSRGSTQYSAA
jgi:hypothetical protein